MFAKILIANRGEIACRVARTARRLGVRTVAVFSDADAHAMHVQACDEAYRIGPAPARESYLDGAMIIAVARRSGAEAIHPGYGFLSENEAFAEQCAASGIAFIGPPPAAIAAMGSKSAAKRIMAQASVPVVPGYHGDDQDLRVLAREAENIGYPVLIKATAGGGGKGMKIVERAEDFASALASAQRQAKAAFADDRVLLEKYLTSPRHIEIQVFADAHGNAVHLFERDCSVQRRHQKVLEEAPAPGMGPEKRVRIGATAVAAAKAIGYVGAGTVEFIVADSFARDGRFWFMEMNTRLQVEHPVTEMITGLDLVEWQLRVAAGEPLPLRQDEIALHGHAIEARLYAEDPARRFLPSIGHIDFWRMPEPTSRLRVDTGFRAGDDVTPYYDPMLAKVIAWGEDRDTARRELADALRRSLVVGVATNAALLVRILENESFASGEVDTGLIERHRSALFARPRPAPPLAWIAAAAFEHARIVDASAARAQSSGDAHSPWHLCDGWTNGSAALPLALRYRDDDREQTVECRSSNGGLQMQIGDASIQVSYERSGHEVQIYASGERASATVVPEGEVRHIVLPEGRFRLAFVDLLAHVSEAEEHAGHLMAPMSGTVVAVMVKPGDKVAKGAALVLLEAMKMEHTIAAPAAAMVVAVNCAVGDRVAEGADLVDLSDPGSA